MDSEELVALICGGGLASVGAFIGITNWLALVPRRSGHQPSLVPFFGGCLMLAGMAVSETLLPYWWTAIVVDWTVLPFVIWWGPQLAVEAWKYSEFNVVHRFESIEPDRPEQVVLYRHGFGEATIPAVVSDDPKFPGYPARGRSGDWSTVGDDFELVGRAGDYSCRLTTDDGTFRVVETINTIEGQSLHNLRLKKSK